MNRRDFIKSFALILAAFVPPERDNMQIGDILKKMGASTLTHAEQEALRLWGNDTQTRNSNVGNILTGGSTTNFDKITANEGVFGVTPIGGSYFGSRSNQTMTHATLALTLGDDRYYDENSIVIPYSTGTTKYQVNPIYTARGETTFFVSLFIHYDGQITGQTQSGLACYKKTDDSLYPNVTFFVTVNTTETGKFLSFPMNIKSVITLSDNVENVYFSPFFHNDSGGDFVVNPVSLSFSRIR